MAATRIVILFWLIVALVMPARAFAFAGRSPAPAPAAVPPADATTSPPEDAVGDLTTQREQAAAATRADPSPTNHHREGQLAEQAGEYEAALASYEAELAATRDAGARTKLQADIGRVRTAMRGRVLDEPQSTHRKELDARWSPPQKDIARKPTPVAADQGPQPKDRIVRKWYFWVAIAAIAASAGAVTGIAIKAARDDKPDALDRRAPIFGIGTPALRF